MADKDKFADEMLTDEQLDGVTGGTFGATVSDSEFLYNHGLVDQWHGTVHFIFHWESASSEVDAGWAKAGITCISKPNPFVDNQYFVGGKEITRDEAMAIVKSKFPKIREA